MQMHLNTLKSIVLDIDLTDIFIQCVVEQLKLKINKNPPKKTKQLNKVKYGIAFAVLSEVINVLYHIPETIKGVGKMLHEIYVLMDTGIPQKMQLVRLQSRKKHEAIQHKKSLIIQLNKCTSYSLTSDTLYLKLLRFTMKAVPFPITYYTLIVYLLQAFGLNNDCNFRFFRCGQPGESSSPRSNYSGPFFSAILLYESVQMQLSSSILLKPILWPIVSVKVAQWRRLICFRHS